MSDVLTVDEADNLVTADSTRTWWETYAKTLVIFRPGRGKGNMWRTNGYYNRNWRSPNGRWGTIRRVEVGDDGLFRV